MRDMREALMEGQEIQRYIEVKLPEYRVFDLLSSVGNAENKALTFLVMREGVIYARSGLYQEVMSHQGGKGWRIDRSGPFEHCQKSLSPVGLVTEVAISSDGTRGYQITEYGVTTGIPFAGLLLKWSHEHPKYSLYKMFGTRNSPSIKDEQTLEKKRAQEIRYRIFWEIITNPYDIQREADIIESLGEEEALVRTHLLSLAKNGVISYESVGQRAPFSYFRLKEVIPDEEPKPYPSNKILSTRVYNLLKQLTTQNSAEYLSAEQMVNALIQEYSEYKDLNIKGLKGNVVNILSHLERQEYLERKKFSHGFCSELTLSDEQREAIVSLVTVIDKFKNGDIETIGEGRRFALKLLNDPNLFSELMLKAKQVSPFANRASKEDMQDYLLSILQYHPNSAVNQIEQILEQNYGKRLTTAGIYYHLSALARQEKIVFEGTKSGNAYRLNVPPSNN